QIPQNIQGNLQGNMQTQPQNTGSQSNMSSNMPQLGKINFNTLGLNPSLLGALGQGLGGQMKAENGNQQQQHQQQQNMMLLIQQMMGKGGPEISVKHEDGPQDPNKK